MAKYLDSKGLQHVYSVFKTKFSSLFAPKSHTHDDRYYTESEVNTKLNGKANTSHNHDDRYYTESEINSKLNGKQNTGYYVVSAEHSGTLDELINAVRYSSGCMGSSNLSTYGDTIPAGWYNYFYSPHRFGTNTDDNHMYGTLILTPMTFSGASYIVRFTLENISEIKSIVTGNDSRLSDARPASDVYAWAKASSKPSYSKSEVGLGNVDNTADKDKSVKYAATAGSAPAKKTTITVTLSRSSWSSGVYTISNSAITTTSIQFIDCAKDITPAQFSAFASAQIVDNGQSAGKFSIKAMGTVPTVDIPVTIVIMS